MMAPPAISTWSRMASTSAALSARWQRTNCWVPGTAASLPAVRAISSRGNSTKEKSSVRKKATWSSPAPMESSGRFEQGAVKRKGAFEIVDADGDDVDPRLHGGLRPASKWLSEPNSRAGSAKLPFLAQERLRRKGDLPPRQDYQDLASRFRSLPMRGLGVLAIGDGAFEIALVIDQEHRGGVVHGVVAAVERHVFGVTPQALTILAISSGLPVTPVMRSETKLT